MDKNTEQNPYLNNLAQDEWNDLQAYHIENKLMWRNLAILAIVALVIVSVYAMYLVSQDKHKTVVFEKDNLGNLTTLGIATKSFDVDNKIIAHQLYNFIVALREAPVDVNLKRRNIAMVHKMIDPKLQNMVNKMIVAQYVKAKDKEIVVNVTSLKPLEGGKSWEIAWQESLEGLDGNLEDVTNWSTIITFKRLDIVSPEVQIANPIGLFITYIHPTQDIVSKG